eukprot:SAG22_NODE_798_length_7130_cov_4.576732_4_plen_92_part_00
MLARAAAAAMLVAAARAQAPNTGCEGQLVSMSSSMNSACCATPADCPNGSPAACSAECAQVRRPPACPRGLTCPPLSGHIVCVTLPNNKKL